MPGAAKLANGMLGYPFRPHDKWVWLYYESATLKVTKIIQDVIL